MRKLFVFNLITIDGYFAGPHGEIDWHNVDAEFNDFAVSQLKNIGMLVFGRVTYDLMAHFWPLPAARREDPFIAEFMNTLPKVVFSKTLKKAEWQHTRVVKSYLKNEIVNLKRGSGKDVAIFGSGTIVSQLVPTGLIDEYRLLVNPIILGKGKPLFKETGKMKLKLVSLRAFKNGNVLLTYK